MEQRVLKRAPRIRTVDLPERPEGGVIGLVSIVSVKEVDGEREYYLSDDVSQPGTTVYFLVKVDDGCWVTRDCKHIWKAEIYPYRPPVSRSCHRCYLGAYGKTWRLLDSYHEELRYEELAAIKQAIENYEPYRATGELA